MHLEILVEEPSAKAALDRVVPRILASDHHTFDVHPFRGKQKLLAELERRLRGYAHWIPEDWRIVVLLDEDRQNCLELKGRVLEAGRRAGMGERLLARIAIEELEAWFLGDPEALRAVYPKIPASFAERRRFRDPDAVRGGTWEALDRLLRDSGYPEGLVKTKTADAVADRMQPERNRSRSFQVFRDGIRRLVVGPG